MLLLGALLARGKRTVTACLRVVGLGQDTRFQNYHRVLNRAKWRTLQVAKILFGLILIFVPAGGAIVLGGDDTIERRRGQKIKQVGCYRNPVRYEQKTPHQVLRLEVALDDAAGALALLQPCLGLALSDPLVPDATGGTTSEGLSLSSAPQDQQWPEQKGASQEIPRDWRAAAAAQNGRRILMTLIRLVARWTPGRMKVLVVDGGFAALKLALVCAELKNTALVMRFHWDATLHHFPAAKPGGRRGPAPSKGPRQLSPKVWAARGDTEWEQGAVTWYGGEKKQMKLFTRTALWYTSGYPPVAIRYVTARDPEGKLRDEVFACTDLNASAEQIIEWFVMRWSVDVTFEEAREHLGMETQRQWSDLAIARATPCLLGLFSLVILLVSKLQPDWQIPILTSAWYQKTEATFSDCLALVRKHLWNSHFHVKSA